MDEDGFGDELCLLRCQMSGVGCLASRGWDSDAVGASQPARRY